MQRTLSPGSSRMHHMDLVFPLACHHVLFFHLLRPHDRQSRQTSRLHARGSFFVPAQHSPLFHHLILSSVLDHDPATNFDAQQLPLQLMSFG
jgi:hypothetical protein